MTLHDHVSRASEQLVQAGVAIPEARNDAELLARHVLGWDRATYLSRQRELAPLSFNKVFVSLLDRRTKREPVSLIIEKREFWGLSFEVARGVLTPRQETELIVETSRNLLRDYLDAPLSIADVGTGSGCLAVSLATEFQRALVSAIDISHTATILAKRNTQIHCVDDRVSVIETGFSEFLRKQLTSFDLIVANLPYIPTSDTERLPPEVRLYEPHSALDGGPDGLVVLRQLISLIPTCLKKTGHLIVEIGIRQDIELGKIIESTPGIELVEFCADLQGILRTAVIKPVARKV